METRTSISITKTTWKKLNKYKLPDRDFEDIIKAHLTLVSKFKMQEELKEVLENEN